MAEQTIMLPMQDDVPSPSVQELLATTVPDLIIAAWHEAAADHVDSGAYLAALALEQSLRYPYLNDPMAVAVVNTTPQAAWLEDGRAGFHLAARWGARKGRWKIGKDGKRYAHVAFRVRTPGSKGGGMSTSRARFTMPKRVQQMARTLGPGQRLTGFGDLWKQSKSYNYYRGAGMQGTPAAAGYTWASSPFEGMMQSGMRNTPGGGTQSEYTTIRTITPDSPGWYLPPTPAYHFSERALQRALPEITRVLEAAAAQDAMAAVLDAVGGLA